MKTLTPPNFQEWAANLIAFYLDDAIEGKLTVYRSHKIEAALKQAFEQGQALGYRIANEACEPGYRGNF